MSSASMRPSLASGREMGVALILLLILAFCSIAMSPPITTSCGLRRELLAYSLIFVPVFIVVIAIASPYVIARCFSHSAKVFCAALVVQGAWLFALALGMFGSFVLPAFLEVFASFGVPLPTPTVLVKCMGHWLWLPLGLLGVFSIVQKRMALSRGWLRWLWASEACLFSFVWGATYLPIFAFGCVIR